MIADQGGQSDSQDPDGDGGDRLGDGDSQDPGDGDRDSLGDGDSRAPGDDGACDIHAMALADELFGSSHECTIVLRLSYETLDFLGYQIICGAPHVPSETEARSAANAAVGCGGGPADMVNPASPMDEYVFLCAPVDVGWVAAVSVNNGKLVFHGSTIHMGQGEIIYPRRGGTRVRLDSAVVIPTVCLRGTTINCFTLQT